jgi:hypothetical protein
VVEMAKPSYVTTISFDEEINDYLEKCKRTTQNFKISKFINHLIREKKIQDEYERSLLEKETIKKEMEVLEVSKQNAKNVENDES